MLHRICEEPATRFNGIFTPEPVERYVFETYAALARTATIRTYLTFTASRFAKDRLKALAQSKDALPYDVSEVLFVCRAERRPLPKVKRLAFGDAGGAP
ncbi:three-helix bundle dimerization domain-containing protein [Arthrobacter pigmenti]